MNRFFIYNESTSELYSGDGRLLKTVRCPKAKHWNQLLVDDPLERSRGCNVCGERVLNLDVVSYDDALAEFPAASSDDPTRHLVQYGEPQTPCVHTTGRGCVVVLADPQRPKQHLPGPQDLPVIQTVWGEEAINRAARAGFWPDVRLMEYRPDVIRSKLSVYQDSRNGEISVVGDYRGVGSGDQEVIPFTFYYPRYRSEPIAAYLIPRGLQNGTRVLVAEPIEDVPGSEWNQGDVVQARDVPAVLRGRRVELHVDQVQVAHFVG